MLRARFHPAAEAELLDAKGSIKSDDEKEAMLFEQAFAHALDCIFYARHVLRGSLPVSLASMVLRWGGADRIGAGFGVVGG